MISRHPANTTAKPLLDLIEHRFDLRLPTDSFRHLATICEHYDNKRTLLLLEHGEAVALKREDYAKAVMISEAARLMLREIDPWPRRKKAKRENHK